MSKMTRSLCTAPNPKPGSWDTGSTISNNITIQLIFNTGIQKVNFVTACTCLQQQLSLCPFTSLYLTFTGMYAHAHGHTHTHTLDSPQFYISTESGTLTVLLECLMYIWWFIICCPHFPPISSLYPVQPFSLAVSVKPEKFSTFPKLPM